MSLFNDMTNLSKQHAENSGSYTFEKPAKDCEKCEGFGWVIDSQDIHRDCITCNGTGRADGKGPHYSEPEPAPKVSLYNLLDYSPAQLDHIHNVLMLGIAKLDSIKLSKSETYQDATAFARILETLMKEKNK